MKDNKIRLQKHLAECGIASRRKAEELIEMGKVKVNGHVAVIGQKVDPKRDKITVRGKTVVAGKNEKVYIMLHKPRGFVTTTSDEKGRKCVTDLVKDAGVKAKKIMVVEKAVNMAKMMDVPVLGLVENYSYILCPDCGKVIKPYGESRIEELAAQYSTDVLAKLPIDGELASQCDKGVIELFEGEYMERCADIIEKKISIK